MAFFTRVNSNVPFLPPDQCHLGKSCDKLTEVNENDVKMKVIGGENKQESNRYEYVVDRVLGVEV